MDTSLLIAVIAAVVSAVGWIATYVFSLRLERKRSEQASALEVERKNLVLLVEEAKNQLATQSERRRSDLSSQIEHVSDQLENLYGPLVFLIYEGRYSFADLLQTLGRSYIFPLSDEIADEELDLWLFWVETDLMPRNVRIQQLLASNTHLIEGEEIPESYWKFIDHYNSWRVTHERWTVKQVPYSWHSKTNWPMTFELEVIQTFNTLKRRHADLIGLLDATSTS